IEGALETYGYRNTLSDTGAEDCAECGGRQRRDRSSSPELVRPHRCKHRIPDSIIMENISISAATILQRHRTGIHRSAPRDGARGRQREIETVTATVHGSVGFNSKHGLVCQRE